jgi:hypothetical protein
MRIFTAIVFGSSIGLAAQEEGIPHKKYLAFGFTLAQGHAHDMTETTWAGLGAFAGEFGLQFNIPRSNTQMRPNFGIAKINAGNTPSDVKSVYSLMGIYVGFDVVYKPFKNLAPDLFLASGPSFHVWNVDLANPKPGEIPPQGDTGLKFGWRIGAGYEINSKFKAELDFVLTEWRKIDPDITTVWIPGFNPSRPAYFTLKGIYCF